MKIIPPDDAVLRAVDRVLSRAAELRPTMSAQRALLVAVFEVAPASVEICDELARQDTLIIRARRVHGERESAAFANVQAIANGLRANVHRRRHLDDDADGLVGFEVERGGRRVPVLMRPDPPEEWGLRRCYIDGNSWTWKYAADIIKAAISESDD